MQKFLLAENPRTTGGETAIIHLPDPQAIILIEIGHHQVNQYPHNHYTYTGADGMKDPYTFILYHCFVKEFDGEQNALTINKLFTDAWHWYISYLKWEDNNIKNKHGR